MIEQVQAFYVPIYKVAVTDWNVKKQQLLNLVDFDNSDFWSDEHFSDYHHHKKVGCPYIQPFCEILDSELGEIVQVMGKGINIHDLWAQRYAKSNYMAAHNHGGTGYSCVLYADFDQAQHTATRFIAPFNNFHTGSLLEYTPDVKEGELVLFPSVLMHDAAPNQSDKHRTIFSFNCKFVDGS